MKNATGRSVKINSFMSSQAFISGFMDRAYGNGWNEKPEPGEQWKYERGRMFAAFLESCGVLARKYKLRAGRYVTRKAVNDFKHAVDCGAIV